jgi:cation diffusion facilitator family transporter
VLFLVGGLFAVYEGVEKLRHPHEIDTPAVAFTILGVAVVLELFSLRTAVRAAREVRGELGWVAFVRRSKSPELPVVLLEDLGALLGLVFALTGVSLAVATGEPRYDGAATLAIGVLLVLIAVILVIEMKSLLIGESATVPQQEAIRAAIEGSPGVRRLIHMRTLHLGPEELLVAAKVELEPRLSAQEIARAVNSSEERVREAVPIARVIYMEPDIFSAERQAAPGAPAA